MKQTTNREGYATKHAASCLGSKIIMHELN